MPEDYKSHVSLVRGLEEIRLYRNVLKALVLKNLVGRYKNSFLGFFWHFLTPIIMMIVYYVVFTEIRINKIDNYWVYLASGLFPFSFMVSNIIGGASTFVNSSGMIKKMYFPREILVLSQLISSFFVMVVGIIIVMVLMIIIGVPITIYAIMIIPFSGLMLLFIFGLELLLSSLTVYIRDLQYALNSLSMVLFFMTPMYFTTNELSGVLNTIVWINPLTYYVESFHNSIFYGSFPTTYVSIMCLILPIVSLTIGIFVFNRLKNGFPERL